MIKLHCGDCLKIMPKLPKHSVDMILCDLPYGCFNRKWDTVIPFEKLWQQYERLIKPKGSIVLFANMIFAAQLIASNFKQFRHSWVWVKNAKTGFLNCNVMPLQTAEHILVFGKQSVNYYPQMELYEKPRVIKGTPNSYSYGVPNKISSRVATHRYPVSVLQFNTVGRRKRRHVSEKPVDLLQYLIKTYTMEGDTVLDNTMGSGSTGVAAIGYNRSFIGIEKDPKFFQIAEERIDCDILSNNS